MAILDQLYIVNVKLTTVEDEFSSSLGEASRWLEHLLMIALLCAVVIIEGTGLTLTIIFSRSLSKTLSELNDIAKNMGAGNFNQIAKVRSGDELGQLADSINKMTADLKEQIAEREHAEHASQVKNLFLANMSHEIRTPLNAILGFSELLRDQEITNKDKSQYLDIIKRTGKNLAGVVNDILDLTKVEAEQLEIDQTVMSLPQLMKDIELLMTMRCEEKSITMKIVKKGEIAEYIYSDTIRLKQILTNIIGNAIKFTDNLS